MLRRAILLTLLLAASAAAQKRQLDRREPAVHPRERDRAGVAAPLHPRSLGWRAQPSQEPIEAARSDRNDEFFGITSIQDFKPTVHWTACPKRRSPPRC